MVSIIVDNRSGKINLPNPVIYAKTGAWLLPRRVLCVFFRSGHFRPETMGKKGVGNLLKLPRNEAWEKKT